MTLHDIYVWALAWIDRERLRLRIATSARENGNARMKSNRSQLPRNRGSGARIRDMLASYIADRKALYDQLVADTLAQACGAQRRFRATFGPAAIARHWLRASTSEAPQATELGRLKRAVQAQPQYLRDLRPLLARPPRQPSGWQPRPQSGKPVDPLVQSIMTQQALR